MTIDDKIRDEKLKYDITREAPTLSPLNSHQTQNNKIIFQTDPTSLIP